MAKYLAMFPDWEWIVEGIFLGSCSPSSSTPAYFNMFPSEGVQHLKINLIQASNWIKLPTWEIWLFFFSEELNLHFIIDSHRMTLHTAPF